MLEECTCFVRKTQTSVGFEIESLSIPLMPKVHLSVQLEFYPLIARIVHSTLDSDVIKLTIINLCYARHIRRCHKQRLRTLNVTSSHQIDIPTLLTIRNIAPTVMRRPIEHVLEQVALCRHCSTNIIIIGIMMPNAYT